MSSFVPFGSPADLGAFETGLEVLSSMSENGNLAASEFYHNLDQVKQCLDRYKAERTDASMNSRRSVPVASGNHLQLGFSAPLDTTTLPTRQAAQQGQSSISTTSTMPSLITGYISQTNTSTNGLLEYNSNQTQDPLSRNLAGGFTTAMAFMEPTMQDFLAQSDLDLGLLNPVGTFMDDAENLYSGHEFS